MPLASLSAAALRQPGSKTRYYISGTDPVEVIAADEANSAAGVTTTITEMDTTVMEIVTIVEAIIIYEDRIVIDNIIGTTEITYGQRTMKVRKTPILP